MKTPTKIAIAGLLSAAGAVLSALAAEFGGATPESPEAAASPAAPETPRRGRKKEEPVAPAANADPAPAAVPAPSDPTPPAAANGEITNPDYTRLRALIDPLIRGGQGPDVKAIIQKYAPDGGLKVMEKQHHAAFEKDIAALSY